jgi:type IX secretion system PorP/SprF family membrane protein
MKLVILLFVLVGLTSHAQQLAQYSQWSSNQFALNPAHAGIKSCADLHTLYRIQWVGFEGAPRSGFFTLSVPLPAKRKQFLSARHGMGFKFETDQIGQFSTNRFNLAYAMHMNFNKNDRLSLGLYGGGVQMSYNPSTTETLNPDPSVMRQANFLSPDASFGAWYNSTNFYLGLVFQNLIPTKWEEIGDNSRYRFHSNIYGGYRYEMNEKLTLLPALLLRIPPRGPISADLNVQVDYLNKVGFGLGFRNTDALIAFVNFKFAEQFSVGYSFDFTLSKLQKVSQNTHEISLRFSTCKSQKSSTSACPMFE